MTFSLEFQFLPSFQILLDDLMYCPNENTPLNCLEYLQRFFEERLPGLKYPCDVHAEKSIHLKTLEWTSMVQGYSTDTWISICVF